MDTDDLTLQNECRIHIDHFRRIDRLFGPGTCAFVDAILKRELQRVLQPREEIKRVSGGHYTLVLGDEARERVEGALERALAPARAADIEVLLHADWTGEKAPESQRVTKHSMFPSQGAVDPVAEE